MNHPKWHEVKQRSITTAATPSTSKKQQAGRSQWDYEIFIIWLIKKINMIVF